MLEFGMGFRPCQMCLYERIPYFIIIGFSLWAFCTNLKATLFCSWMILFAFIMLAGLSFFHIGIEQGWFNKEVCAVSREGYVISCGIVEYKFLGISLASWNFILGFVGSILHGYFLSRVGDDLV